MPSINSKRASTTFSPSSSLSSVSKILKSTKNTAVEDAEFASKRWVWLADDNNAFIKGFVVSEQGDTLQVRCSDGSDRAIKVQDAEKVNPPQFDKADDMAELTFLNEASVVHNLHTRYTNDSIYTYSGLFLVAVNPYKQLPLYNRQTIEAYKNKQREEAKPHIFAISDLAFRNMLETYESQSILVTGESGAGKTENTKKVIQYLAAISEPSQQKSRITKQGGPTFEQQILQANPILESFGNAQTVRNNNSSRFGKFIRLEFSRSGQIAGASIDWYLLEKSRVIHPNKQERNYHVFYQLVNGASKDLREALLLEKNISDYAYLKNSNWFINGVDDKEEFKSLISSFKIMGLNGNEQNDIFRLVSSILHLGNIEIGQESIDQGRILNVPQAERVCHLLGIPCESFMKGLLKPRVKAGREWVNQSRSASQIRHSLDALAKSLYERLFGYIVNRINKTLDRIDDSGSFIGVLDIAGFEIFENNSFEQLSINYTNEKLQQFFNHHMFVLEQEEYSREQIDWKFVDFGHDLQPTIDLIEKSNPMGIFSCLDEDCVMPKATDKSFTEKLTSIWDKKSSKFKRSKLSQGFILTHYAADVEYSTEGWLEKNKDPLNDNVVQLLAQSSEGFVKTLFIDEASSTDPTSQRITRVVKKGLFRTAAQKHKEQLNSLMNQLNNTHPHFVRCIIPNHDKLPKHFDNLLVLDQLRCNGVLEGIRIARSGYPNRLVFSEFRQRYEVLVSNMPKGYIEGSKACTLILKSLGLDVSLYKVGLTKVFFKSGVLAELEEQREEMIREMIVKFQSIARGHLQRVKTRKELFKSHATDVIKKNLETYLSLKKDPWWKLYVNMRPLLIASRENNQQEIRDSRLKKLEKDIDNIQSDKAQVESELHKTEQDLKKLNQKLEGERLLANDREEILKRSKLREEELQEQLTGALDDLDKLEIQCDELLETQKQSQLESTAWKAELEKGAALIASLEKDKIDLKDRIYLLEDEIDELKESHKSNGFESEKL